MSRDPWETPQVKRHYPGSVSDAAAPFLLRLQHAVPHPHPQPADEARIGLLFLRGELLEELNAGSRRRGDGCDCAWNCRDLSVLHANPDSVSAVAAQPTEVRGFPGADESDEAPGTRCGCARKSALLTSEN
jgi:hypothetical protein